jgi:N-acetylmuramoyl-L-alanine amidase
MEMRFIMATVDQSGIVGKIRDRPIGNQLVQLLKSAAEATGIDKVYVTSGSQPGTQGLSTGSTRHNNGRAADLQLIANGVALTFSDSNGGRFANFVTACAARGATGMGAGVHYMGNRTIHVGYGTSPQDHSKLVWGANGASANAPQWLRDAAQDGWAHSMAKFTAAQFEEDHENAEEPESEDQKIPAMPNVGAEVQAQSSESLTDSVPCCDGMAEAMTLATVAKPLVEYIASPYQFSRNGADIDYIVLHYTTTRSLQSTINHFLNNSDEVAAHYVIGRDGRSVQMVKDKKKCYHGNSKNNRSIGIEHSAAVGDALTADQEEASLKLIRWLMHEYDVPVENVIPHKCAPRATSCPGELFSKYGATGTSSCNEHRVAVQAWLSEKL